jgi:hypothetical protein
MSSCYEVQPKSRPPLIPIHEEKRYPYLKTGKKGIQIRPAKMQGGFGMKVKLYLGIGL